MEKKTRIAVICMGGSISTYKDPQTGANFSFSKTKELSAFLPPFENIEITLFNNVTNKKAFLNIDDWIALSKTIHEKAKKYSGFVVLQETDSVLMGAAVIAFLTTELNVPIIFTSSPNPVGILGGQKLAEKNISGAIEFAALDIAETAIFTNNKLIRAVRGKRRNIVDESPFFSGQIDDIGGYKDEKAQLFIHRTRRSAPKKRINKTPENKKVFFIRVYPGYPIECLDSLRKHNDIDVLIIESLGYGSLPPEMLEKIMHYYHLQIPVVVIAEHDSLKRNFVLDADQYKKNKQQSFVLVQNMTVWSTVAKAHVCIENADTPEEFYKAMKMNMAGEIIFE